MRGLYSDLGYLNLHLIFEIRMTLRAWFTHQFEVSLKNRTHGIPYQEQNGHFSSNEHFHSWLPRGSEPLHEWLCHKALKKLLWQSCCHLPVKCLPDVKFTAALFKSDSWGTSARTIRAKQSEMKGVLTRQRIIEIKLFSVQQSSDW